MFCFEKCLHTLCEKECDFSFIFDKCDYIFEYGHGKLIVCFNSIIVGSEFLCDGLYILK